MNQRIIFRSSDKKLCASLDWPEEPEWTQKYDGLYKAAIAKALEEAIPFEDEAFVKSVFQEFSDVDEFKENHPYSVPEGYRVEVKCDDGMCQLFGCDKCTGNKLAYLVI